MNQEEFEKLGKQGQEVTLEILRLLETMNGEQLVEALELARTHAACNTLQRARRS